MKLILVLLLIGLFAGCSRKSDSLAPTSSAPPSVRDSEDSTSTAPVVAPQTADPNELAAALHELTQVLRKYSFEHRRLPKTFSEVVAAGYVKNMPQAPPGKKFEIDPRTVQVVLVKQ